MNWIDAKHDMPYNGNVAGGKFEYYEVIAYHKLPKHSHLIVEDSASEYKHFVFNLKDKSAYKDYVWLCWRPIIIEEYL